MASLSGPRLATAHYIKHPPAASSYWSDGAALDAGMAQIIDSNINWLVEQSCRHLVADTNAGVGTIAPLNEATETWLNLSGYTEPDDAACDTAHLISWEYPWGHCYGPFVFIADRVLSNGAGTTLREVVVQFDYLRDNAPTTNVELYAALSPSDSPPDVVPPWIISRQVISSGATGQRQTSLTLTTAQPLSAARDGQMLVGRAAATNAGFAGLWVVGYLWTGFVSIKLDPAEAPENVHYATSAWEKR